MWFSMLTWLSFVLLVAAFFCSLPVRYSLSLFFCFVGALLLLLFATPILRSFRPEWFAVNQADLLESRPWLPIIVPLISTAWALPIVSIAAIVRYFIFRRDTPTV